MGLHFWEYEILIIGGYCRTCLQTKKLLLLIAHVYVFIIIQCQL